MRTGPLSPRPTRRELTLVLIIFAIGFGLRAAYPSRMAVEHFDEGVYASNLYTPEGRYPFQHLYAPPLLPFCLEWAAILRGPHAVMWVNVVSGSLTLLVLWGMVRQWWGPPAAIAAMVLLAFNEFHIAFSRAALTDAMLGLWMTAGVWAGWRAIQLGGPVNIAAAGGLAALAWWTKYNGWLTLAITGSGMAGWILFGGGRSKAPKTDTVFGAARVSLGRWVMTAGIGVLLWSPWVWELQPYGGYAVVARNHAGYFTGLGQWWGNAVRQCAAIGAQCHWLTQTGIAVAVLAAAVLRVQQPLDHGPGQIRSPATWLAASWLIGLTVAVPLYQPYPRLCLPWLIGLVTVIGGLIASRLRPVGVLAVIAAGLLYGAGLTSLSREVGCWEERTGLQRVADHVLSALQSQSLSREVDGARCVVAVVAEPGLYFQLSAAQRNSSVGHVTIPAPDFGLAKPGANTSELPLYFIAGPHADQSAADRLIAEGRVEQIAEFEYRPSNLVLLDSRPAWDLPSKDKPFVERIRLLHVKP